MKVVVRDNRTMQLSESGQTQCENNTAILKFVFPEKYDNYNKKIAFIFPDGKKKWDFIDGNEYKIPRAVSKYDEAQFYVWLTEGDNDFRSKTETIKFNENDNVDDQITEEEIGAVTKILKILEEEIEKVKDLQSDVKNFINDLQQKLDEGYFKGDPGKDALINGHNVVELIAGDNIHLKQEGNKLEISSNDKDTKDYGSLENKPQINGIELKGNKTLEDLGYVPYDDEDLRNQIDELQETTSQLDKDIVNIDNRVTGLQEDLGDQEETLNHLDDVKADRTEIPDVSEFIKKTVNDLVNYYKKTETYTQQEVNQLIGAIKTISMEVLPERPETGENNIIYLIPSQKTETENIYEEWIYINNKWELIGTTKVDLSNYYNKDEIKALLLNYITSNDLEEILDNYVKNTDYPSASKAGVVKLTSSVSAQTDSNGVLYANVVTYNDYLNKPNSSFIGKGTLENVIEGKELVNKTYVNDIVGNIETALNKIENKNY